MPLRDTIQPIEPSVSPSQLDMRLKSIISNLKKLPISINEQEEKISFLGGESDKVSKCY